MNEAQLRRAGRAVAARIDEMGTNPAAVARAAGIGLRTLRGLIGGEHWPTNTVQKRVEAVLRWKDGELVSRAVRGDRDGTLAQLSDADLADELARRLRERDAEALRLRASDE